MLTNANQACSSVSRATAEELSGCAINLVVVKTTSVRRVKTYWWWDPAVVAFDIAALALHLTGRGDLRWLAASSYQ